MSLKRKFGNHSYNLNETVKMVHEYCCVIVVAVSVSLFQSVCVCVCVCVYVKELRNRNLERLTGRVL